MRGDHDEPLTLVMLRGGETRGGRKHANNSRRNMRFEGEVALHARVDGAWSIVAKLLFH